MSFFSLNLISFKCFNRRDNTSIIIYYFLSIYFILKSNKYIQTNYYIINALSDQ